MKWKALAVVGLVAVGVYYLFRDRRLVAWTLVLLLITSGCAFHAEGKVTASVLRKPVVSQTAPAVVPTVTEQDMVVGLIDEAQGDPGMAEHYLRSLGHDTASIEIRIAEARVEIARRRAQAAKAAGGNS